MVHQPTRPVVKFTNPDRRSQGFSAYLDDPPPKFDDTQSGYKQTARPKRDSLVEWEGRDQDVMILPIMFDGFALDKSIEHQIAVLLQMTWKTHGQFEPPTIRLHGPIPLAGATTSDWKILRVEWGDYERSMKTKARTRQRCVVHLVRNEAGAYSIRSNRNSHATTRKVKVTHQYNTLQKIANHYLGDWRRYRELMSLNHIRDPEHLRIGRQIKLPSS